MRTMELHLFQAVSARWSQFCFHASLKVSSKNTLVLAIRLVSQKSKTNRLVKAVLPYQIIKQKFSPRNSCSKGFARFQINVNGGVHLQKSLKNQVLSFTKDRLRFVVPIGILKIFGTANYFHYYVMLLRYYVKTT